MLYELIPTMPEVRLLPLIKRFTTMLAELPVFADPFGHHMKMRGLERQGAHLPTLLVAQFLNDRRLRDQTVLRVTESVSFPRLVYCASGAPNRVPGSRSSRDYCTSVSS